MKYPASIRRFQAVFLFLLLSSASGYLQGQTHDQGSTTNADSLLKAQQWNAAAAAYEIIVTGQPSNSQAWHGLAQSRYSMKQYGHAAAAFEKENELTPAAVTMYNIACCYALQAQPDKAMDWLEKAVGSGLPIYVNPAGDSDLGSLAGNARFKDLVHKLDTIRRPCLYSPAFRAFDFWIGHWDVYNPAGRKAGSSIIEQTATGCAIMENWTDLFGRNGRSLNFYDAAVGKWYQYWIGANGQAIRYSGTYRDGAMRFETDPVQTAKGTQINRLTFFNLDANTVRQFAELSVDGGKTWSVSYDFKYVRTK